MWVSYTTLVTAMRKSCFGNDVVFYECDSGKIRELLTEVKVLSIFCKHYAILYRRNLLHNQCFEIRILHAFLRFFSLEFTPELKFWTLFKNNVRCRPSWRFHFWCIFTTLVCWNCKQQGIFVCIAYMCKENQLIEHKSNYLTN